jgi:hypothetical protein
MAWCLVRRDYAENSELYGKPLSISCDLGSELKHHGKMYGICEPH